MQHIPSTNRNYTISQKTGRIPVELDVGVWQLTWINWSRNEQDPHFYHFLETRKGTKVIVPFANTEVADATIAAFR